MNGYQQSSQRLAPPQRIVRPAQPMLNPNMRIQSHPQQQRQRQQLMNSLSQPPPPPSPDYLPPYNNPAAFPQQQYSFPSTPPAADLPFPTPAQQLQMSSDPFAPSPQQHPSRPQSRPLSQPTVPPGRMGQQSTPTPVIPPPPQPYPPQQQPQTPQEYRPAPLQTARSNQSNSVLGSGQGLIRLLQFSGILAGENKNKLQLSWWNELVKEYFTPKATMKFTLWKDNQQQEAKPFEIGIPILPRFFLVTTQSGVKSMTLTLDGARERIYAQGHAIVECVSAVWTYKYINGYTVTLRGPLTAHVVVTATQPPNAQQPPTQPGYVLKIEEFEFGATHHDKSISLDAILGERMFESPLPRQRLAPTPPPGSAAAKIQQQRDEQRQFEEPRVVIDRAIMPGEPVNAFGIPQATMRCLELAESVGAMAELITFADETKLGPLEALTKFANKLRANGFVLNNAGQQQSSSVIAPPPSSPFQQQQQLLHNGIPPPPQQQQQQQHQHLGTLYQSAPSSITGHPPQQQHLHPNPNNHNTIIPPPPSATVMSSPQHSSSASNSPSKQHRSIPQQQASGSGSSAQGGSPSMSNTNTPALSNASLKRKQVGGDAANNNGASPTMASGGDPMGGGTGQGGQGGQNSSAAAKRGARKRNRTNPGPG